MTLENNIAMQITIHRVWPKNDFQDLIRKYRGASDSFEKTTVWPKCFSKIADK